MNMNISMDNNNNKIGKNRKRPFAGLEFSSFQYKAAGLLYDKFYIKI